MNTRSRHTLTRLTWLSVVALSMTSLTSSSQAADSLKPYRDRFQTGLERYRMGDIHGALQYWEAIREELGETKAYRLLFNLGKSYEKLGDATKAYLRYQAFLDQVDEHAKHGPLSPVVSENRARAQARVDELLKTRGRIRVKASLRPGVVAIDDGAPSVGPTLKLVAPGKHKVVVDPGTELQRMIEVDVSAGQEFVVDPTRPKPEPPLVVALPKERPAPAPKERPLDATEDEQRRARRVLETRRPFPGYVLAVSGGLTAVSMLLPLWMHQRAQHIADEYESPETSVARRRVLYDDYGRARNRYNLSWALPGLLAGTTVGLTTWYMLGSETTERVVTVSLSAKPDGAGVQATGKF